MTERWPPIYDADDLAATIAKVAGTHASSSLYGAISRNPPICQGDVVELPAGLPVLDEGGEPLVLEPAFPLWLVIGNTCDFARARTEVQWTQVVPVYQAQPLDEVRPEVLTAFSSYQYSRRFFLPPWPGAERHLRYADFLTPVGVDKEAMTTRARVVARLTREGWILLHSCLIRFLCRDDGRFD